MAFSKEPVRTPTGIADIEVRLYSPDPTSEAQSGASFAVQVRYSDGSVKVLTGDLVPHLTTQQINSLLSFMAAMRTKAVAEILP